MSGGDHKLRRTLYNVMTKATPVKIGRHRNKVQDHSFTDKYLPRRARPGDYAASHAEPSEELDEKEKEWLKVDNGEDIQAKRKFIADIPPARSQEVLLPQYNDMTKAAPVRVGRHRNKVQDLSFTDKYLEGKAMPCNYTSRHGVPIEGHNEEEKGRHRVDNGKDIQVRRVFIADLDSGINIGDSHHGANNKAETNTGDSLHGDSHHGNNRNKAETSRSYTDLKSTVCTSKYLEDTDKGADYQGEEGRGHQDGQYEGVGAGLGDKVQGVGAGLGAMVQDEEAGPGGMVQDVGAGLDGMVQDVEAGLDGNVQGVGAGLDDMVQDVGAGLDKMVQGAGAGLD